MTALLPTIPGHHAGATRDEAVRTITGNGGPDLAGRKASYIGKHRADDAPTEVIPVIEVEILALIVDLDALGADVRTVEREPEGPCTWCQTEGHDATVTVYGDPDPRDTECPIEFEQTCRECAPTAVRQACLEQRHDARKPVQVEIGVSPR